MLSVFNCAKQSMSPNSVFCICPGPRLSWGKSTEVLGAGLLTLLPCVDLLSYKTPTIVNKGHYKNEESQDSVYLDVENYPVYSPSKYPLIECSVTLSKLENMSGNFKIKKKVDSYKGQLILRCSFSVFKSPKKPTKILSDFLP